MDIRGAHVLLTGASGGIGQALVEALANRGACLTLTARRTEVLSELADRVGGTAIAADLSDRNGLEQLLAEVDQLAPVDVLIANAGVPASGLLPDYSADQIDRALDVNLRAPIILAKQLGEQMASRGSGHLVFMSSLAGKSASGHLALYNATKFGIRGFALALREDMRLHGVGVSTIFPGPIRDAGMIADTDVRLPRVGTRTARTVADATLRAIEKNRAEVTVAAWALRAVSLLGSLAPDLSAAMQRRIGSNEIIGTLAEGQQDKR